MKAFLLAAGLGKRMLPLTENKPKCLLEAGGKSLLRWNVERLKSFGYDDLVINLHHEGDQIKDFLKDGSHLGVKAEYIHEEELLGTGGAIGNALKVLGEDPFLLLSSDIWTDFDFSTFAIPSGKLAHLVLIENPENNIEGDMFFENKEPNMEGLGKKLTFSGISLINPVLFKDKKKKKYNLWSEVLEVAVKNSLVSAELYEGYLININTKEDLEKLDAFLAQE
ncbi:MAG: NDP-sugar synthase [Gammaproteobacteria bacterium]